MRKYKEIAILIIGVSCLGVNVKTVDAEAFTQTDAESTEYEVTNTQVVEVEVETETEDVTIVPEEVCIVESPEDLAEEEYYDSLEYVAMCVEAEAGNQGFLGKVYVADCILNRYDTGKYDSLYDVINEKGQFSVVSNGTINCVPSEETYQAVAQELDNRTNSEILYFRTNHYHTFGTPCFKYGDHYFSK